jgi:hypothetical protein
MASGYFPLWSSSDHGVDLLKAADLVHGAVEFLVDDVYSQDQPDNAAKDGAHIARLRLAEQLIRQAIQGDVPAHTGGWEEKKEWKKI